MKRLLFLLMLTPIIGFSQNKKMLNAMVIQLKNDSVLLEKKLNIKSEEINRKNILINDLKNKLNVSNNELESQISEKNKLENNFEKLSTNFNSLQKQNIQLNDSINLLNDSLGNSYLYLIDFLNEIEKLIIINVTYLESYTYDYETWHTFKINNSDVEIELYGGHYSSICSSPDFLKFINFKNDYFYGDYIGTKGIVIYSTETCEREVWDSEESDVKLVETDVLIHFIPNEFLGSK